MSSPPDRPSLAPAPSSADCPPNPVRNAGSVHCPRCNCLLLRADHGLLVRLNVSATKPSAATISADRRSPAFVPQVQLPKSGATSAVAAETETVTSCWQVDDIFTFENMGFSHTVQERKYLACAECEFGPIGFHDMQSGKSYLSLDAPYTSDCNESPSH